MPKYKILVTGVGAVIGYGIIKSLRDMNFKGKIYGIDIYPDAVGRKWCDHFEKGVRADDDHFLDFISDFVEQNNIDLIIPGIEQDVDSLSAGRQALTKPGVKLALNSENALKIFNNKLTTYNLIKSLNLFYLPYLDAGSATADEAIKEIGLPCIAKPYESYAGKGLQVIHDRKELELFCGKPEYVLQQYCAHGKEYTTSIFGLGDGSFCNPIILERTLGPDGATHKAKTVFSEEILNQINLISQATCPVGPTNMQFIQATENSPPCLLEVNPRVSSSTSLRTSFGVNEAEMCIEYFLEERRPKDKTIKPGKALRYLEDIIEYDCDNI
jgi:carbamoyl-phosphate synthase large subunit